MKREKHTSCSSPLARVKVKNLATIIEGAIGHILNITPKEEKMIEGIKRLTLASHIFMEKIMLRST